MTRSYASQEPTTGLDLITVAEGMLDAVRAMFAANGVELPSRQYIATGSPQAVAWDCDQLVVVLADIGWGRSVDATQLSPSFGKQASVNAMRHATFALQLVRKVTTIQSEGVSAEFPDATVLDREGRAMLTDAGLLSQAMVNFVSFPNDSIPQGCNVQAGAVQPSGPSGEYAGLETSLVMTAAVLAAAPDSEIPAHLVIRNGSGA